MAKLDKNLVRILDQTGLPWAIEHGKKHRQVRLNGMLVGILPLGKMKESSQRAMLGLRAHIQRAAREMKNAQDQAPK